MDETLIQDRGAARARSPRCRMSIRAHDDAIRGGVATRDRA